MTATSVIAEVTVEKVNYKGWPNCYRVTNGEVELIVTGDVGPRIIRFGFVGGQNLFKEYATARQVRGGEVPIARRPSRLEGAGRPDRNLGAGQRAGRDQSHRTGLIAREPVEPLTGLQKEIKVEMAPSGTHVTVTHRITNKTLFPLEFAPWALTMMAPGGVEITGFPPRGKHPHNLEATNPLSCGRTRTSLTSA